MPDLATQIRTYLDDTARPVTFEEIFAEPTGVTPAGPTLARLEPSGEPHRPDSPTRHGGDLVVDDPQLRPHESDAPTERKAWIGVATAVAATILVVVGVVVAADPDSGDVATEPASSPVAADPDSGDVATEPASSPVAADLVSPYRWSRVPHDDAVFGSFGENRTITEMKGVIVGGPGLVAVGSYAWDDDGDWQIDDFDAVVWTSVDGLTWTRVPSDEAVFGGEGVQEMWGVTAGGPGLVAIGMNGSLYQDGYLSGSQTPTLEEYGDAVVWTSGDGVTWSRVPHDEAVFGGAAIISVTAGGPGLVAVGRDSPDDYDSNAVVWTSVDGLAWSRVPHDEAIFGGALMSDVTAGGPGLVAVGGADGDAVVWTSVGGVTWSRVPYDEAVFGERHDQGGEHMRAVAVGGPGLVAVGGFVWTSVDGLVWSRVADDETRLPGIDVTATDSGLVATGWDGLWTSVDGLTWSPVPSDEAVFGGEGDPKISGSSVTVGGPGLVVVGGASPSSSSCCGDVAAVWVGVDT